MMPTGRRNKFVMLYAAGTPSADADGDPVTSHAPFATAYAAIEPASSASLERLAPGTVISQATHTITLPYVAALATTGRVFHGARRFDVQSVVNPKEENRELILVVAERVP